MVYYEIWFDLKHSHKDLDFCDKVDRYLGHMRERGHIEGFTLRRRMLGLGPASFGDFNITIQLKDLKQLDDAFQLAATRGPDVEPLHAAVYSSVTNLTFGLSRDFPDSVRISEV